MPQFKDGYAAQRSMDDPRLFEIIVTDGREIYPVDLCCEQNLPARLRWYRKQFRYIQAQRLAILLWQPRKGSQSTRLAA